jgi:hypothetical protein
MKKICIIFFVLNSIFLAAQTSRDTLYLMNGKIYVSPVLDTLLGGVTIIDFKDSTKKLTVDNEDLFSVNFSNGEIRYYYRYDTIIGNYFTRDEMVFYMHGERDAKKGFSAKGAYYGGFAAGFVGGLSGNFLGPIVPFTFFSLCGIPKVRIKHETISNPYFVDHDPYLLGYERRARSKRRTKSLIGGGIGLVAGYAVNVLIAILSNK